MIDLRALQQKHPTWNIVDAIPAIDGTGGIWAVGADGGVFTLNANGDQGAGESTYFGSYTGLRPEDRQGTRSFVGIRSDPNTGGYVLISNQIGQNYDFKGDRPINQAVDPATQPAPGTKIEFSDTDLKNLEADLKSLGLGDLVGKAWAYYKDPQGGAADPTATLRWLEETPEYRDHFPGLAELKEQGRAWTPAQWNQYYNQMQEAATTYGLPPGMIDRNDIGKMITGNVSAQEAVGRIQAAGQSVYNADPVLIDQMRRLGFTDGDLTAFYLDADKAAPLLERKAQEEQGRIAAAAQRTGYDPTLGLGTTQQLQQLGVNEQTAQQGFAALSELHPLFANTVGETTGGEQITGAEQLGAQFGQNVAAQQEISRRRQTRAAQFQGGGGAASGGGGRTGLG